MGHLHIGGQGERTAWWTPTSLGRRTSTTCASLQRRFKKIPGKTYYIYKQRKNPDQEFLSMISPEEWGPSGPEFIAGYRLEFDMSWTELKDLDKRGNELALINKILDTNVSDISFNFLPSQYQASKMLEGSKNG